MASIFDNILFLQDLSNNENCSRSLDSKFLKNWNGRPDVFLSDSVLFWRLNKKRSRAAIFSVRVADKKLVEQATNVF